MEKCPKFITEISRPARAYLARKGLGEEYVHKQQCLAFSYLFKRLKSRMPSEPIITRYMGAKELKHWGKNTYACVNPNKDVIVHLENTLKRVHPYVSHETRLSSVVAHEFIHRAETLIWDNFQAFYLKHLEITGRFPQVARFFPLFGRTKPVPAAATASDVYFWYIMLQARANYLELQFTHTHTTVRHELWQLENYLCRINKAEYTGYAFMKYLKERIGLDATLALTERMRVENDYEFWNPKAYYDRAVRTGVLSEILVNCKNL